MLIDTRCLLIRKAMLINTAVPLASEFFMAKLTCGESDVKKARIRLKIQARANPMWSALSRARSPHRVVQPWPESDAMMLSTNSMLVEEATWEGGRVR